jgi:glutamyl-tRNA synthetase
MKSVFRYAPSPTGPQHVGGLRTALYSYLLARKLGGEFILRIEDTDQGRFVPGAEEFIVRAMEWLGIEFTQGVHIGGPHAPYRQSERSALYQGYAKQLVDAGHAYYAFDTSEELEEMRHKLEASGLENRGYNYVTRMSMRNSLTLPAEEVAQLVATGTNCVVRLKVPSKADIRFHDEIRGPQHWHSSNVDDRVLLKSDGLPTYHLANVVDDHTMGVTHVVRGEEWLSSTPTHVLLYEAFGWTDTMPKFAHLSLLLDPEGKKLSKRNADKFGIPIFPFNWFDQESGSIWEGYKDLGYLPEALLNYIAFLGWHPGGEQEIFSVAEMVNLFSLERCHHDGARFDMAKLKSFQEHYLRLKSDAELAELSRPAVEAAGYTVSDAYLQAIAPLMRERVAFAHEIVEKGKFLFEAPQEYDMAFAAKNWKQQSIDLLAEFLPQLAALTPWTTQSVHDLFHAFVAEKAVGFGKVMAPLRLALTGVAGGPGCFEMAEAFGQAETLQRIQSALDKLPAQ